MKKFLYVAPLLLLIKTTCFASETGFLKEHACIPAGEHISSCEIHPGDSLSKDAAAVYGDWHRYPAIKDANPEIADANVIYAGKRVLIPSPPTSPSAAIAVTPRVQLHAILTPKATLETISDSATITIPTETIAPDTVLLPTTEVVAAKTPIMDRMPASDKAPTSAKTAIVQKVAGYEFTANGSNLHGPLQTQLILFNSEEEKRLGLVSKRIDLKPSLAVPATDGNTTVFVHLKELPAQPFSLLVGGINTPVDSTQIRAHIGKKPGSHPFLRTMATIGKIGAQGGISFIATGNPFIAASVVGVPRLVNLVVAQREKAHERRLEAAQSAVDKSKLALYRASIESKTLSSKEILQ